jgi:hypothetical protein
LRIPHQIQRSERRNGSAPAEHQGGKAEEIGVGILPRMRREAGLVTNLLQERGAIPFFFAGNLRQQQTFVAARADQQPVLPDVDLLDIHHTA